MTKSMCIQAALDRNRGLSALGPSQARPSPLGLEPGCDQRLGATRGYYIGIWSVPKLGLPFFVVPIMRFVVFWAYSGKLPYRKCMGLRIRFSCLSAVTAHITYK